MNYTIQFSPEATNDLTDILGWYKEQQTPDLQKKFITAMSNALKMLSQSPKSYALRFKNVRCAIIKKYPYNVYYWVDDTSQAINIFAVLHQSRSPKVWKKRL